MACFVSSPFLVSQYRPRPSAETKPNFYYSTEATFEPRESRSASKHTSTAATPSASRNPSRQPRPSTARSKASTTSHKSRDASPLSIPVMIPFMPSKHYCAAAEEQDSDVETERDSMEVAAIKPLERSARFLAPPKQDELQKKRAASRSPSRREYFNAMLGMSDK